MLTVQKVLEVLEAIAPVSGAMAEDVANLGLQVGDPTAAVTGIMTALDADPDIVEEAAEKGCNVLVTHHPLIYGGIDRITPADRVGATVMALNRHEVNLLVAHTNLDNGENGVNETLCRLLGVKPEGVFGEVGRIGSCAPIALEQLRLLVQERLCAPALVTPGERTVTRVAVLGGAGGGDVDEAADLGADVLITGEAKHHQWLEAQYRGLAMIVAGHHATEVPVIPVLTEGLQKRINALQCNVTILHSERMTDPISAPV